MAPWRGWRAPPFPSIFVGNQRDDAPPMTATARTDALRLLAPAERRRQIAPPPAVPIEALAGEAAMLEKLRQAARRARAGRQMSLAEAQACLACPGAASGVAEVLVRVLAEVLGRRPVFHAPGARMASFDEAWLCRCRAAQAARDSDSLALLTGRRVHPAMRRAFLDLLRAV